MSAIRKHPGPWAHRVLVYGFSLLFGLLVYWLLGFVVRDIATWPGPTYQAVERELLDPQLSLELESLREMIEAQNREVTNLKQRQATLRDSTSNSERTMNQLLELQRLTLQRGLTPSAAEIKALADSQALFLTNQTRYQDLNDQVANLSDQLRSYEDSQRQAQARVQAQRQPVVDEFNRRHTRHQLQLAALKLSVLLPLLAVAVWLFLRKRGGLYAPLIYGFGLALLVKTGMVMHEHFPRRYFKYVLLGTALLLVGRVLIYLLRMMAFPKADWLLKQYREAYERFACPVCAYPIRRGPLKYLFWNRRSLRKLSVPADPKAFGDEPYVCPVCGTRLFEPCPACQGVRHSLLPACAQCGAEKPVVEVPRTSTPT